MSNRYGSDPELVLAGGAHSARTAGRYIKASGTSLATITEDGFVGLIGTAGRHSEQGIPGKRQGEEAAFLADVMAAKANPDDTKGQAWKLFCTTSFRIGWCFICIQRS